MPYLLWAAILDLALYPRITFTTYIQYEYVSKNKAVLDLPRQPKFLSNKHITVESINVTFCSEWPARPILLVAAIT